MAILNSAKRLKAALAGSVIALTFSAAMPHIALAQENPLIVEADNSLEWLRTEKQYVAKGNATATQGDMSLTANVITAHYETEENNAQDQDATIITFIRGDENAKLTRTSLVATANVIEYDILSEFVKVFGGNPVIISGGDTLSASETITYDRKTRQIVATGDAKIKLANGQQLRGNLITVIITKDEGDIESVTAQDNTVVISPSENGESRAEADKMVYTGADGIAILTGNVIVKDGGNVLTGDRAEVNTTTGTSAITSTQEGKRVGGVFNPAQ